MKNTLKLLNDRFGIVEQLEFKTGPGGLTVAEVTNRHATAAVVLQGAHVLSFQPHGQLPVLWASEHSHYQPGKAIRGGIPVIWPWFGDHPTDPDKPAHGFARTMLWLVSGAETTSDGKTQLRLHLVNNEQTESLWPYPFRLEMIITVGRELHVALEIHNSGPTPFACGSALHSYFGISEVSQIAVDGLDGCTYIDKVSNNQQEMQQGPITIAAETDRIYVDTEATCIINDVGWSRRIIVAKSGSRSTVVWNPWINKAKSMADFGDEEYIGMICVETTNAAKDTVTVEAGATHILRAMISVEL